MQIIEHHQKNIFFISGMFAGAWIWDRCYQNIHQSNLSMMAQPLCYLSDNIEVLTEQIAPQIERISGKVSLVGNSLGSLLCMKLAERLGDKIEAIVISGAAGFGHFAVNIKLRHSNAEGMRNDLINAICHDTTQADTNDANLMVRSFHERFRSIIRLSKQSNMMLVKPILSKISCPVFAIWGKEDQMTPFKQVKPVLDEYNIKTFVINSCGHSPMYEKPKEFAQHLNACLFSDQTMIK